MVSVNAALRRNEEAAQLDHAASRLECYDVVETKGLDEEVEKLIKLYSNLDITTAPMPGCPKDSLRTLLREGDLKLRDAATSKVDQYGILIYLIDRKLLLCLKLHAEIICSQRKNVRNFLSCSLKRLKTISLQFIFILQKRFL